MGVGKLLVDARDASGRKSQTGDPLTLFRTLHTLDLLPVLLGGGIDPNNVEEILDRSGADALDIMSGTETAPGEKSERLIADLMYRIGGNR